MNAKKRTIIMVLAIAIVCSFAIGQVQAVDKSAYGAITVKEGYPLAKDRDTIKANLQLNRASELFL